MEESCGSDNVIGQNAKNTCFNNTVSLAIYGILQPFTEIFHNLFFNRGGLCTQAPFKVAYGCTSLINAHSNRYNYYQIHHTIPKAILETSQSVAMLECMF